MQCQSIYLSTDYIQTYLQFLYQSFTSVSFFPKENDTSIRISERNEYNMKKQAKLEILENNQTVLTIESETMCPRQINHSVLLHLTMFDLICYYFK